MTFPNGPKQPKSQADVDAAVARLRELVPPVTCPRCNGQKRSIAHVNFGGARPNEWKEMDCSLCNGSGTVSQTQMKWIEEGKRMRDERQSRDVSLREEAKRLGMSAADLSAIETGMRPALRTGGEHG